MRNRADKGAKTRKPILQWILTVYFGLSIFVFFPSFASVLYILVAAVLCPAKRVRAFWNKIMPKKKLRTILVTVTAMLALIISPTDETVTQKVSSETTEAVVNTEEAHMGKTYADDRYTGGAYTDEVYTSEAYKDESADEPYMGDTYFEVHYIDVGQGDSTLVLCDGDAMLIDGGASGKSSVIYSYLAKLDVNKLDYMIASHPHDDHVGGLAGALNFASVEKVLCSTSSYDSTSFEKFLKYVEKQDLEIEIPEAGDHFCVGSAVVEILGVNASEDVNNSSIVLKVTYGDTAFLFTGDAEEEAEQALLDADMNLHSTVLKVGHHGSAAGTTLSFLQEAAPEYAIISVGKDNSYGHPTREVLSRLKDAEIETYRTDLQGDIICKSDGSNITITVKKNADADTLDTVGETTATDSIVGAETSTAETIAKSEVSPEDADNNGGSDSDNNGGSNSDNNGGSNSDNNGGSDSDNNGGSDSDNNGGSSSGNNSASGGGTGNPNIGQLEENEIDAPAGTTYVLNTNTKKFHYESCRSAKKIKDENRAYYTGTREECISMGYDPCGNCHP